MAGDVKMLPPNIRVDWIPTGGDEDEGIEDINAPTAEELNAGTNISCAISQNDFTLAFSERDTNDEKSLCDDSNVQTPVYKNYEGSLTDRKSTRLNSSHVAISYAVFCLKKKKQT